MTTLQRQARALGDPTRHAIFRYVVDAGRPVGVAELTEHLGLNHNAIRQHLAKLVDAELLVSGTMPSAGRGRPRLSYEPSPSVDARWGVEGPYERLAVLLSEMVRTGSGPVEVGRRAGAEATGARGAAADATDALMAEMHRQGFAPEATVEGDLIEIELADCPFATVALQDPANVCGLHLGLAQGVADAVGGLVVEELERRDPTQGGCRLRCRRVR